VNVLTAILANLKFINDKKSIYFKLLMSTLTNTMKLKP
jgi:hypothetical protein